MFVSVSVEIEKAKLGAKRLNSTLLGLYTIISNIVYAFGSSVTLAMRMIAQWPGVAAADGSI
jgi:hypothetical protein